jgi:predicted HTH domain antitoxin
MQITISVPDEYVLNYTQQEMSRYLKLYTALLMFQSGQLSAGAACEFADIDRYSFSAACKEHHIPVIDYEEGDIDADIRNLTKGRHKC